MEVLPRTAGKKLVPAHPFKIRNVNQITVHFSLIENKYTPISPQIDNDMGVYSVATSQQYWFSNLPVFHNVALSCFKSYL